MEYTANFVDRTGHGADQYRKRWRVYHITINPNIQVDQDAEDYEQFRDFFFFKIRQLYRRDNMAKAIDHVGAVEWPEVVVVTDTTFEYGEETRKLHTHTVLKIAVPWTRTNANKVSLSYEKFHALIKEIFPESEFKGINCRINYVDPSILNLYEYQNKKARA